MYLEGAQEVTTDIPTPEFIEVSAYLNTLN